MRLMLLDGGPLTVLFFALVLAVSAGMNIVKNMQVLYFVNELKASNLLCGLAVVVTIAFEAPMFLVAAAMLRKFGANGLAVIAALAYGFRTIAYACLVTPWMVLFVEPLHGVTFAALNTGVVAYVSQKAAIVGEATAQSVFTTVKGVGSVMVVVIGSVVLQFFGGRVMYCAMGIVVLAVMSVFILASNNSPEDGSERVGLLSNDGDEDGHWLRWRL